MRILLTAAGSWLGKTLVERLTRDHPLLALGEAPEGSVHADGELGDVASLCRAMEGIQVVLHLAAASGDDGNSGILEAARIAGVRRVVWVGHAATLRMVGHSLEMANLRRAESMAVGCPKPQVSILQPATMVGPGRSGGPPPVIGAWLQGRVPTAPGGGLSFVDVRDVGAAIEAAMTRGPTGQGMPLASAAWSFQGFYSALARLAGRPAPRPDPRHWMAGEHAPELDPGKLAWQVDSRRAALELGWWTRSPERSLRDTLADAGVLQG
jgi:nucleoside-diphosphate-sugar epimerase